MKTLKNLTKLAMIPVLAGVLGGGYLGNLAIREKNERVKRAYEERSNLEQNEFEKRASVELEKYLLESDSANNALIEDLKKRSEEQFKKYRVKFNEFHIKLNKSWEEKNNDVYHTRPKIRTKISSNTNDRCF